MLRRRSSMKRASRARRSSLPRVSYIFLLRDPERSLLSMYAHRTRLKIISDWPNILSYYEGNEGRQAEMGEDLGVYLTYTL